MSPTITLEQQRSFDPSDFAELLAREGAQRVREPLLEWLASNAADRGARFVPAPWLRFGGEPDLLRDHVKRWLDRHAESAAAGFVLQTWLRSGGEPKLAKDGYATWMAAHKDSSVAWHVAQAWLSSGRARTAQVAA
jgi:hypothetical protein